MGEGECLPPLTVSGLTLNDMQAINSIMIWLFRAVSMVYYSRELLPRECFKDTLADIQPTQLSRSPFALPHCPSQDDTSQRHKVLVKGVSLRGDALFDLIEKVVLPDLRLKRMVCFQLLIVADPFKKPMHVLEDYVFTINHDGHTSVDVTMNPKQKSRKKVVVADVVGNIKHSLQNLRHVLMSLDPLPS
ncbi:hypothetical protein K461DRAFT_118252 [Myriangium duriaei CBS 260.36]|uniref:HORMA domain-containing protein n=1 Tax=Myriangium duriaei CBS 260.36 TaxID=1168546 RepID=A0A9P4ML71_9PEZI|nr:hypothetical protein K461DRAFT_118252 [Myriangium duriaei CBS 260.36]